MEEKRCIDCGEVQPISNFYIHKSGISSGHPISYCKECSKRRVANWQRKNTDKRNKYHQKWCSSHRDAMNKISRESSYRTGRRHPLQESKDCAMWLADIGERILVEAFGAIERMPPGNRGYDFICKNGYKIDAKTSCIGKHGYWQFGIRKNHIADYFICIGFDNRKSLEVCKVWIFPGKEVFNKSAIGILANSKHSKYDKYLYDISKVNEISKQCNRGE